MSLPDYWLDMGWECFPTPDSAEYGLSHLDDSAWTRLPEINQWPQTMLHSNNTLYLRHSLILTPTDACVHYHLRIEHAPAGTDVYINGWHLGTATNDTHFERDVTQYVSLDPNLLLFIVHQPGTFGSVQIITVPCSDAD